MGSRHDPFVLILIMLGPVSGNEKVWTESVLTFGRTRRMDGGLVERPGTIEWWWDKDEDISSVGLLSKSKYTIV